jgi:hypothetical protein
MKNNYFFKAGAIIFGVSIIAIGIVCLVTGGFPTAFLPLTSTFTGETVLAYLTGVLLIASGVMMAAGKFAKVGALLFVIIFLPLDLIVHIPKVCHNVHDGGEWTVTFELFALISGSLIVAGMAFETDGSTKAKNTAFNLFFASRFLLALCFFVFGMLHYEYEKYIETLLLPWMPFKPFWCWLVMSAFFALFVSFVINKLVSLSSFLLFVMFAVWVVTLHGPLVATHLNVEPQWTSLFIAMAMSGIGLMVHGALKR